MFRLDSELGALPEYLDVLRTRIAGVMARTRVVIPTKRGGLIDSLRYLVGRVTGKESALTKKEAESKSAVPEKKTLAPAAGKAETLTEKVEKAPGQAVAEARGKKIGWGKARSKRSWFNRSYLGREGYF